MWWWDVPVAAVGALDGVNEVLQHRIVANVIHLFRLAMDRTFIATHRCSRQLRHLNAAVCKRVAGAHRVLSTE